MRPQSTHLLGRIIGEIKMMKCLFLSALATVSGLASAQSSVTIYGIADVGIQSEHGAYLSGTRNSMVSGGNSGARLGFRGAEDLGGGMQAIFNLQGGLNLDEGSYAQGGLPFGRTAYVGLQGGFGTLKLGRIDSALYQSTWYIDPLGDALGGGLTRIFTLTSTFRRNDNTVDYTTPKIGGFTGEGSYSLGEVAGSNSRGRRYSASVTYGSGPISVSLAHQNVNSAPAAPAPIVTTKLSALGAAYDFDVVKLSALYQINRDNAAVALDTRDVLVGASVPFGAHTVMASYIKHFDEAVNSGDANQIALAYTYALSKRSNLYAGASRIKNGTSGRFGLAAVVSGGAATGTTANLYLAGIRHNF
jgi:predicted porin